MSSYVIRFPFIVGLSTFQQLLQVWMWSYFPNLVDAPVSRDAARRADARYAVCYHITLPILARSDERLRLLMRQLDELTVQDVRTTCIYVLSIIFWCLRCITSRVLSFAG